MSNLCADIAKDFVENNKAYYSGSGTLYTSGYWVEKFKKCKDFPREPDVIEYVLDIPYNIDQYTIIDDKIKGKKWRAVFTEIIE